MKIGNSSKIRARRAAAAATAAEAQNSKAAILARKRERWRVQKEVHDAQQQFRGAGRRLGDGAATRNDRPAPSLPGAVDSPSPPPHARRAARAPPRARSALSHLEDNDILTQLTERIASRLKVELRHEVENAKYDDATKKDVSTKIESFLQNELQQHTCPVCFEPMLPPARSPMLLFPCGHTFCEQCINHQKKVAKHQCPLCRAKIERVAVNHSRK
jgi:rubrerythrin